MKRSIVTACLYTLITALLLGLIYPLAVTAVASLVFRDKANGQLIRQNGEVIGSKILGQSFTGPGYFHSRPSAAGTGYDASASSGSNLAPTNRVLVDRIAGSVASEKNGAGAVPVDLVTASGSGLDPDITPAAAFYQVPRVARERNLPEDTIRRMVGNHIKERQLGLLGEPRVNVLELNLALSATHPSGL